MGKGLDLFCVGLYICVLQDCIFGDIDAALVQSNENP